MPDSSRHASWSASSTPRSRATIPRGPVRAPRLYAIADAVALAPLRLRDAVQDMTSAGVRWIQIRAKQIPDDELVEELEAIDRWLDRDHVTLWIDDRADLARLFDLDLHLGQTDLPAASARGVVGPRCRIGQSTHSIDQVRAADADAEVDVVAVGPVYPTRSKERPDPVVGLELVRRARDATAKPLVAIGGIDSARIADVLAAGADSAVVLGDVCRGDLKANLRRYSEVLESGVST